jgi:dienelactone hydrolase
MGPDLFSWLAVLFAVVSGILVLLHGTASNVFGWLSVACITWHFVSTRLYRANWRVWALYVVVVISSAFVLTDLTKAHKLSLGGQVAIVVVLLFISLLTAAILTLFPVPTSQPLAGPYKRIGTTTMVIDDNKGGQLNVQCWFPISKEPAPLLSSAFSKALLWTSGSPKQQHKEMGLLLRGMSRTYSLPHWVLQHLKLATTNAEWCSECDMVTKDGGDNSLPIAIYSHGMYGWRQVHVTTAELLASYGFVVFACDHVPDSMVSRPHANLAASKYFDYNVPEGFEGLQERQFYHEGINRRVDNVTTVIDFITSPASTHRNIVQLGRVMDVNNINLWGHSFGAGTVCTVSIRDKRIRAAVLLDSWIYPVPNVDRQAGSCNADILLVSAEKWKYTKFQMPYREDFVTSSKKAGRKHVYSLIMRGSDHQAFCDVWMIAHRYLLAGVLGTIDPVFCARGLDHLTLQFFLASQASRLAGDNKANSCSDVSLLMRDDATATSDNLLQLSQFLGSFSNVKDKEYKISSEITSKFCQSALACVSEYDHLRDYASFDKYGGRQPGNGIQ